MGVVFAATPVKTTADMELLKDVLTCWVFGVGSGNSARPWLGWAGELLFSGTAHWRCSIPLEDRVMAGRQNDHEYYVSMYTYGHVTTSVTPPNIKPAPLNGAVPQRRKR